MKVSDAHIQQLRDDGYSVIENFIEPELLSRAQEAMWELCPRPADYFANTGAHAPLSTSQFAGLHRFPFPNWDLNRLVVNLQPRGWRWTGRTAWPREALSESWSETMVRMTPQQRALFGFPAPGDEYWDEQTIRDVGMRYSGMDMDPYRQR